MEPEDKITKNSILSMLTIALANKSDKKDILRFYKVNNYSARFIGFDKCYLIKKNQVIIASVIVSKARLDQQESAERNSKSQYFLHALVVAPTYQKQGLATQLVKHSLTLHSSLVCFSDASLAPLYLKQGFKALSDSLVKNNLTIELFKRFQQYSKHQSGLKVFFHQ
jgi:GNAT superfamily N-acetyltransferase